jgi:hypothetical protein
MHNWLLFLSLRSYSSVFQDPLNGSGVKEMVGGNEVGEVVAFCVLL